MRLDVLSLQLEGYYSTPVMVMCVAKAFRLIAASHSVSILRAIPCRRKLHSHIRLAVQVYPVSREKYINIISGAIWYSKVPHHVETFNYKAWFKKSHFTCAESNANELDH